MNAGPVIILLGLRGAGKSSAGRVLAARLGAEFVDLDDITPALLGEPTAADAIRNRGLPAFRDAEARALHACLGRTSVVLALGGGTPTAPGAAEMIRDAASRGARAVYLHADPATLRARLAGTDTATRPSLTGRGVLDEIGEIYLQRDPLFRSLAERVVETADTNLDAVVAAIASLIRGEPA